MKLIHSNGAEVEIEVGGECLTFVVARPYPTEFSTTREAAKGYRKVKWEDLTLAEQNAVEEFC